VNCGPGGPLGRVNTEGCKTFCNAFLVYKMNRLTESDEIGMMREIYAQQVFYYFGELWSTFVGAQIFDSEYFTRLIIAQ